MIRLRPHHLLCALTFVGEGYSDEFIANFHAVLGRIAAGEPIEIVQGPDDVCAPLVAAGDAHCALDRLRGRDARASADLGADPRLSEILTANGLDANRVSRLREAFSLGTIRSACADCSWYGLCTSVAEDRYARSILRADERP